MSAWEQFRDGVQAQLISAASDEFARQSWTSDQIRQAQRDGLRTLLRYAAEHSPFHRGRLAALDIAAVDPADMSALPVMTKSQMMDALDDVFTDPRLRRDAVESALAATEGEPVPILGDYIALASGGCSGRRGVFVLDSSAVAVFVASTARQPGPASAAVRPGARMALVASASAVHATGMLAALTATGAAPVRTELMPATLPLNKIVARLNAAQPEVLTGFASMLVRLAAEATAGRLHISPVLVSSTSETLLPEMRSVVREAFSVPVGDGFGSTEGLVGKTCADDDVFTFNSDRCIVELVDADNRPVSPDTPSAKVLVTNLYNLTQPLIRYELTDTFASQSVARGQGHLRARVQGRSDDVLRYGAVDLHPIVIRSVMVKTPEVVDYQVHQTRGGIDVAAVTNDGPHLGDLSDRLRRALIDGGLIRPDVTVRPVDRLDRHPVSGKLRRFVPITTA